MADNTMASVDSPFVEWVRVENYRCIKSVDLHLTRLHALIGPNDSGKSSLLRAIFLGLCKFWVPGVGGVSYQEGTWSYQPHPGWDGSFGSFPPAGKKKNQDGVSPSFIAS